VIVNIDLVWGESICWRRREEGAVHDAAAAAEPDDHTVLSMANEATQLRIQVKDSTRNAAADDEAAAAAAAVPPAWS
jgi:hypothetical protein